MTARYVAFDDATGMLVGMGTFRDAAAAAKLTAGLDPAKPATVYEVGDGTGGTIQLPADFDLDEDADFSDYDPKPGKWWKNGKKAAKDEPEDLTLLKAVASQQCARHRERLLEVARLAVAPSNTSARVRVSQRSRHYMHGMKTAKARGMIPDNYKIRGHDGSKEIALANAAAIDALFDAVTTVTKDEVDDCMDKVRQIWEAAVSGDVKAARDAYLNKS